MRNKTFAVLAISMLLASCAGAQKAAWKAAEKQLIFLHDNTMKHASGEKWFPRTLQGDSLKLVVSDDWTSGFFPGMLWMMYEKTGNSAWKEKAAFFTEKMHREPHNARSHDVGFKVYNSFGQAYRLTGEEKYKQAIIEGAKTLSTRFYPKVASIKSWDFRKWEFPVIIDNMMNLELLFAATRLSGDSSFYKLAVTHANTTMKNHFRNDYSSYHVISYDTATGEVLKRNTHQGYADSSAWARGQAWALYGFTMCYRETKDPAYLQLAENIAGYLLNHPRLPKDRVPYWDFDAPINASTPRDVSAAAIMASALWELGDYSKVNRTRFKNFAKNMAQTLYKSYQAPAGTAEGFLLLHSTGHLPANSEIDVPLIYADYYYLELLKRIGL
ncbi:MAG: glycoside hydrolase family 88 protein [Chitinophagaceae bacterium]|nr:glycoside hydrolase family 88 protein [Chitinophagaceae bacterium]